MRTRNSYFPNNSNVTILRRRNKGRAPNIVEPELRTIVAPMAERTMEELLRAPTEGYGEAIVLPEINADHFEIKTNFLQLVQANPFYGRESENPHAHINSFKRITSTLRFRNVPNDVIKLMMFPYSLEGAAKTWMNVTFSKTDERIDKLEDQLSTLVEIVSKKVVTPAPVKAVEESCITCGGAHSWYNCPATDNNQASVCATTGTYNQVNLPNRVSNQMTPLGFAPVQNNGQNRLFQNQASTSETLSSNTIPNPKGEMKVITTRSGVAYEGPSIPTNPSPKRVVERETEETMDKEQTNFQGSTAHIPPPVIPISIPEPDVPKTLPKTTPISESNIPKNLRFDISFADALLLMPRFAPTIKSLLMNKEKLLELAKIPLNENCSAMLLKKLPEKLGYPDKFLIPSDPQVLLILGRSFLRTSRALIDVYEGKLVLRDGNEQITFHVDGTSKHPQNHINESIKMVNDTCKDSFKKFTVEPALVCLPSPEDSDDEKEKQEVKNLIEPTAKRQSRITPCLKNFKDFLIMGDEHFSTFSIEESVPIPRESEDTSMSDSKNVLPSCDDFSSINIPRDDSVTFSNSLFEFDVNFISSDINLLFDEEWTSRDDIEFLLHHNPSTPLKTIASILEGFINEPPFEENDDLFDLECKTNDWKRILYDAPIEKAKCFDPGGDDDEIDAFLAIKVPTYIKEGYYDSEGDVSLIGKEIDIFSRPDDSIPPGIESEFESEEDNLLNNDPIPEYERLTFDMEPNVLVINNLDELNEDECFDPGGGEINVKFDEFL
ncbi:hypothetical protein Tco_1163777 [Tanacetum coccineum]